MMSSGPSKKLLLIGQVMKCHGVRGGMKVKPLADEDIFLEADGLYVGVDESSAREYGVISTTLHKGAVILSLKGITTFEQAEGLIGSRIYADKETLPLLPEGEFYGFEILGMKVFTANGEEIGTVEEIFPTGSNDVYVVRKGKTEYLVPAIGDVIERIDKTAGRMTVKRMAGLMGDE